MTLTEQLVASVKKTNGGKIPYAGKEKGKGKAKRDRLPVPPPKGATGPSIVADPKKEGIPVELQTQNRKPLTPEQQAKVDAAAATAQEPAQKQADLRAQQKAAATEKSRVRVEQLLAKKSGATAAMPLTGKAALRAIADAAVEAGHPIQRAAEPKKPLTGKAARQAMRRADKALKAEERAAKRVASGKPAKVARKGAALRPDGLTEGSKNAVMLDLAMKAGKAGITEKAICAKLGWKACAVTLKRVCERVGVTLTRKDGLFHVTGAPKKVA